MNIKLNLLGFILLTLFGCEVKASDTAPDTVTTGIYVTSIHNIDFRLQEYDIHFWVWFRYKNRELNFPANIEIPTAKNANRLYLYIDTSNKDQTYVLMKYECKMNDIWKVDNYPFDNQTLRFRIENSQFDNKAMIYKIDQTGSKFDLEGYKRGRLISEWKIDSFDVNVFNKSYFTSFGADTIQSPEQIFHAYRVMINISRPVFGLFLKTFLGMYIAFLMAFVCFFIHSNGIDTRFGISVGSLFAVIGNKYIIDSHLPDSNVFSLVDSLHGLTLAVIFIVVASTAYCLMLINKEKYATVKRFDMIMAWLVGLTYLIANIILIYKANIIVPVK
ncbi:MAG: hypothetical protein JNL75_11205 [Chitinophagales bacterium]|nr:hypothetical protein [Chitinophagales bacterium]